MKAFLKFCSVSLVAEKLHTSPLSVVMSFTRDEFTWISSWAEKGKKEQVKRSVIAAQSWWNTAHLTCGTDMTVDWTVMWALDHHCSMEDMLLWREERTSLKPATSPSVTLLHGPHLHSAAHFTWSSPHLKNRGMHLSFWLRASCFWD